MTVDTDTGASRLRRILKFERTRGCQNAAVVGGLDALLRNLLGQSPDESSPVLNVVLSLQGKQYADLSVEHRQAWLGRALALLDGGARQGLPKQGPPAPNRSHAGAV